MNNDLNAIIINNNNNNNLKLLNINKVNLNSINNNSENKYAKCWKQQKIIDNAYIILPM